MTSTQWEQYRDQLAGRLVGLARATDGNEHLISSSSTESIVTCLSNTSYDSNVMGSLMKRVEEEKRKMVPDCFRCASPCGKNSDYDMDRLWNADADVRSLKLLLLNGIRGMATCYSHAVHGYHDQEVERFFYKALIVIGMEDYGREDLLPVVLDLSEVCRKGITALEKAGAEISCKLQPIQIGHSTEQYNYIVITEPDISNFKPLLDVLSEMKIELPSIYFIRNER